MDSKGGVYLASRIFRRGVSTKRHKASQGGTGVQKNGQKSVTYFVSSPLYITQLTDISNFSTTIGFLLY